MAKFMLGATERIKKDDSIPVELLPSNKLLYLAKLNNDEDADVTPAKCVNLKEVFEKFRSTERFVMIGLSLDYEIEDTEKFIKDNGLKWSNCFLGTMPDETVAKDYGLDRLPYTILIGPNGKVIAKNPGVGQLESALNKVLR